MAVAVILDFPGGTLDQYDRVIGKMGFEPGGRGGEGGLFHWITKTDDGIRVTDVWETREAFQKFADEQIGPITQEEGMNPPQIRLEDVHNYLTAA